ncbi:uncharacterized protein LOC114672440 isoform X2 [Macaca mulatta]
METVNSLYQLPPAQASLTHRLVTCLEWAAGEHTHEAAQRATGHSSFPVNCVQTGPIQWYFVRELAAWAGRAPCPPPANGRRREALGAPEWARTSGRPGVAVGHHSEVPAQRGQPKEQNKQSEE